MPANTEYLLEEEGDQTVLRVSKVAVGPMSEEEENSIQKYADITRFQEPLRQLVEGS